MICPHLIANYLGCGCYDVASCPKSVCGVCTELHFGFPRKYLYYHLGNDIYKILYSDYIKRKKLIYKQLNLFEDEKD